MDMDTFVVVALEGALGASVAITLDILRTTNQVAESMGKPTFTWKVVGSGDAVRMNNGMLIQTVPISGATLHAENILVVPGLGLECADYLDSYGRRHDNSGTSSSLNAQVIERLGRDDVKALGLLATRHSENGGGVAASCSSVLALGEYGLLDGRTVTTHWRLYELLRERHPACHVDTNRMLVQDRTLITSGAAMSQMDLMLLLITNKAGHQVAELTRRYLLIDGRPSQAHYMAIANLQSRSQEVMKLEKLVEQYMPKIPTLKQLAAELFVTDKTLSRRIQKSTGMTPMAFIQAVRMRHAQNLLETTKLSINEIATKVGYADATALRRLVLRKFACTPSQLRMASRT